MGADVNKARNDGATPLYIAAETGKRGMVRELIDAGADVDKADADGMTPLYIAKQKGHNVMVLMLIAEGANDKI